MHSRLRTCRRTHFTALPSHADTDHSEDNINSALSGYDSEGSHDSDNDDVFDYESDGSCTTTVTEPESGLAHRPEQSVSHHSSSEPLRYSDDPNDDTDEDIANVPLDYGRSDKTKLRRAHIEGRWRK
jgi:hypothetical protein